MSKIIQIYQDIVQSNQRISNVVQNNQDIVQNDQYRDIFQNNQNISIIYIVQNNHIYRDIVQNNQCISKYCPKIIKSFVQETKVYHLNWDFNRSSIVQLINQMIMNPFD